MLQNKNIITKNRISDLRSILKNQNLDGYIQPRADAFLGEYVPKCSARLEWLSGFTGSAGEILVLRNRLLLFVDSRYTIQAAKETRGTGIEIILLSELSLIKWLDTNIKKPTVIGFDPWLYSCKIINSFIKDNSNLNYNFKSINENLIDLLWINKPKPPSSKVQIHPIKYSGASSKSKIQLLRSQMKKIHTDAYIICQPDALAWLLNIRGRDLEHTPVVLARAIILSNGNIILFINKERINKKTYAHLKHCSSKVTFFSEESIRKVIKNLIENKKKIWIDPDFTPYSLINYKKNIVSTFIKKSCPIEIYKAIKNRTEINGSIKAHQKDGIALIKFLFWISNTKQNITEITAANKIDQLRSQQKNFICTSFKTISGFGKNGAIVHYRVSKKTNLKFQPKNLYLVDSGGQYSEGTTDVTRTIAFDNPTESMKKHFTTVLKAHISLASIIFPYGTSGNELDILARRYLWSAQMDYGHGTGHGVGSCLSVHEGPQRISRGSSTTLEPGMILSNEPGFYLKNQYGIRIENLMVVQKNKKNKFNNKNMLSFKMLTLAPIDKNLINKKLLNKKEIRWVNDYHSLVYNSLHSFLDEQNKNWLKKNCSSV